MPSSACFFLSHMFLSCLNSFYFIFLSPSSFWQVKKHFEHLQTVASFEKNFVSRLVNQWPRNPKFSSPAESNINFVDALGSRLHCCLNGKVFTFFFVFARVLCVWVLIKCQEIQNFDRFWHPNVVARCMVSTSILSNVWFSHFLRSVNSCSCQIVDISRNAAQLQSRVRGSFFKTISNDSSFVF